MLFKGLDRFFLQKIKKNDVVKQVKSRYSEKCMKKAHKLHLKLQAIQATRLE